MKTLTPGQKAARTRALRTRARKTRDTRFKNAYKVAGYGSTRDLATIRVLIDAYDYFVAGRDCLKQAQANKSLKRAEAMVTSARDALRHEIRKSVMVR